MNIRDLKNMVELNKLPETTMIWVLENETSEIIVSQYINIICKNNNLTPKEIDTFDSISYDSFLDDDNLYLMRVKKADVIKDFEHCIIICEKCDNKEAIKIPKLEDWQVIDYLKAIAPGVEEADLKWITSQYGTNFMALISDIEKISVFNKESQQLIFQQMIDDGQFKDKTSLNIWDLTGGIVKRDINLVKEALKVIDYIDVEPIGLINALYRDFLNVINIQLGPPNVKAVDIGLSDKQFYVIKKYNCGHYTRDELVNIFEIITNMEYMFKYEELSIESIIDYLIVNILGV